MKRQSAVFLTAICVTSALAIPRAGAEPAWGWRPDEVAHYKQLIKPKSSGAQNAWDAAIVAAPACTCPKRRKVPGARPYARDFGHG